jgi:dihydrolipoamide dehydrogenase
MAEALGDTVVTSREILDLEEVPESLVVIGGGVIGLEMACYYQAVGSKVTVVEMLDHIAGNIDPVIGRNLQTVYEKLGLVFHLSSSVTRVEGGAVFFTKGGEEEVVKGDLVLLSCGRRPVTKGYGLENLPIELDRGAIPVNEHMETACPGLYAIGDVTGGYMLAHAASREGEVAVNHILGLPDRMSNRAMPSVIYTDPEAASVGRTRQELEEEGRAFLELELPMGWSGRYQAETERGTGLCRLFFDERTRELLGCHLLTPYASEIILAFGIMIEQAMSLKEMKQTIFPHPTVCEIVREALFQIQ